MGLQVQYIHLRCSGCQPMVMQTLKTETVSLQRPARETQICHNANCFDSAGVFVTHAATTLLLDLCRQSSAS